MNIRAADPLDSVKAAAAAFKTRLDEARTKPLPSGALWYPYDTLSNIWNLDATLAGDSRRVFDNLAGKSVADVGCADGDLGFFLETRGARVDLIDNPPTNMNHFAGAAALKSALGSTATLHKADLDSQFSVPRERYDLVLLLGLLYHLKNPFYVLERFAAHSDLMLLSTKVAAYAEPAHVAARTSLERIPAAYLLAADECNNDATNYWIFSDAGLRRLLQRTGWEIVDYKLLGASSAMSDPFTPAGDRRAFCLLHSRR